MTTAYLVFEFERRADPDGNLIPLTVRMKLDLGGCKIGLSDWQALPYTTRNVLCALPAESDAELARFTTMLNEGLTAVGRDVATPISPDKQKDTALWTEDQTPSPVSHMTDLLKIDLEWPRLNRFSRYVLWALAKKGIASRFAAAFVELSRSNSARSDPC